VEDGRLVRVEPDGRWQPVYEGLSFPVALAFAPDGQLYVLEFARAYDGRSERYTPNSGRLLAVGPSPLRRRTVSNCSIRSPRSPISSVPIYAKSPSGFLRWNGDGGAHAFWRGSNGLSITGHRARYRLAQHIGGTMSPDHPEHALTLGTIAPDFKLPAIDGQIVALADYRERQPVLLVFYRGWW
jgi:hypothetical protein